MSQRSWEDARREVEMRGSLSERAGGRKERLEWPAANSVETSWGFEVRSGGKDVTSGAGEALSERVEVGELKEEIAPDANASGSLTDKGEDCWKKAWSTTA